MDKLSENIDNIKVGFSFQKTERLCSKKITEQLFEKGNSIFVFPLKIVYIETKLPSEFPVQAAFTVSKKNFKRAVQRNLIKRRMREAYRLNKATLYEHLKGKQVAVFFIYTAKQIQDYRQIEESVKKGITKLYSETGKEK